MTIFKGRMFWSWNHCKATYWFLTGPKVRRIILIMKVTGVLKNKKSTVTKSSEFGPTSCWDLCPRKPALCHPGCVSVSLPLLGANASGPERRLDVKDLELVRTFLITDCDGASRGGCSPSCPEHLSKACSGWACSHLRQKHSFQPRTAPSLCQESRGVSRSIGKQGSPPHPQAHVPRLCAHCPPDGRLLAHAALTQGVGWAGVRLADPRFSSSQSHTL